MKATTFTWTVKTIRFLTPNSAMVDGESDSMRATRRMQLALALVRSGIGVDG